VVARRLFAVETRTVLEPMTCAPRCCASRISPKEQQLTAAGRVLRRNPREWLAWTSMAMAGSPHAANERYSKLFGATSTQRVHKRAADSRSPQNWDGTVIGASRH
jgi:hypothetical protein